LKQNEQDDDEDINDGNPKSELSFCEIITIRRCGFGLLVPGLANLIQGYELPLISDHLNA